MIKVYTNEIVLEDGEGLVLARANLKSFYKVLAARTQQFSVGMLTTNYCLRYIGADQQSFLVERSPAPLVLADQRTLFLPWFYAYLKLESKGIELFFSPQSVETPEDFIYPPWFPPSVVDGTRYLYADKIKVSTNVSVMVNSLETELVKRLAHSELNPEKIPSSPLGPTTWEKLVKYWGKRPLTEDQFPPTDKNLSDLVGQTETGKATTPTVENVKEFLLDIFAECN